MELTDQRIEKIFNSLPISQNEKINLFNLVTERAKSIYRRTPESERSQKQFYANAFLELLPEIKNAMPKADFKKTVETLTPPMPATAPNIDTLNKYIEFGFTIYATMPNKDGKPLYFDWKNGKEWTQKNAKIKTSQELQTAINKGVMRFVFIPSEKNLICFDIDRHDKDGVAIFFDFLEKKGLLTLPIFQRKMTFVQSANNGIHLYFNAESFYKVYGKSTDYRAFISTGTQNETGKMKPLENCEVKAGAKTLTCAGSLKTDKNGITRPYVLYGNLESVDFFQELPAIFERYIIQEKIIERKTNQEENKENLQHIVNKKWHYLKKDGKVADKKSTLSAIYSYAKYKGFFNLNEIEAAILQNKELAQIGSEYIKAELKDIDQQQRQRHKKTLCELEANARSKGYHRAETSYSVAYFGTLNGYSESEIKNHLQKFIESDFSQSELESNIRNGIANARKKGA